MLLEVKLKGSHVKASLSLGGWGCEGRRLISLSTDTHSPGIRDALMDSGVSILNLSTSRKVFSLLRSITGLHLW